MKRISLSLITAIGLTLGNASHMVAGNGPSTMTIAATVTVAAAAGYAGYTYINQVVANIALTPEQIQERFQAFVDAPLTEKRRQEILQEQEKRAEQLRQTTERQNDKK